MTRRLALLAWIWAYVVCCAAGLLPGQTATDKQLGELRSAYEKNLAAIKKTYDDGVARWPQDYLAALKALQSKFQKSGDLEGYQGVQAEIDRFQAAAEIPDEALEASGPELKAVQKKFQAIPAELARQKTQKVLTLFQQYTSKLTAMQTDLTKQNRIEDALAVNAEIKRVKESPEVAAAEFERMEQEAKAAQDKSAEAKPQSGKIQEPAAPAGETSSRPQRFEQAAAYERSKIYTDGKPPDLPGISFKPLALRPTANAGARRKLNVTALLGSSESMEQRSDSSWGGVARAKSGTASYRVRLFLKTTGTSLTVENVTLVVEYYSKDLRSGSGKITPERMLVEHIRIPRIDFQGIAVDCPDVSTYQSSYSYSSAWGGSHKDKIGREFYGIVVSVFEQDKSICYQAVSGSALDRFAGTDIPEESSSWGPSMDGEWMPRRRIEGRMWPHDSSE